VMVAQIVKR